MKLFRVTIVVAILVMTALIMPQYSWAWTRVGVGITIGVRLRWWPILRPSIPRPSITCRHPCTARRLLCGLGTPDTIIGPTGHTTGRQTERCLFRIQRQ